jgi:hypothetical protein
LPDLGLSCCYAGQDLHVPAQLLCSGPGCYMSAWTSLFWLDEGYSGLGLVNPAQAAVYFLFNIPATHNLIYNAY